MLQGSDVVAQMEETLGRAAENITLLLLRLLAEVTDAVLQGEQKRGRHKACPFYIVANNLYGSFYALVP